MIWDLTATTGAGYVCTSTEPALIIRGPLPDLIAFEAYLRAVQARLSK